VFLPYDPTLKPKANTSYVTFIISPQHTFSRGTTHITSSDGLAQPAIDPKYLSWEFGTSFPKYTTKPHSDSFCWCQCFVTTDKKLAVEAVKYGINFGTKEPLKSAIAVNPFNDTWTDSFIEDYVTKYTITEFNPS